MKPTSKHSFELDQTDREIISRLTSTQKYSLALLAKEVGISTTAIHLRVKKLEQAGIIDTSVAIINPKKLGYGVVSYIGVFLDRPAYYRESIEALKGFNEVVEAHYTTGNYTLFLKIFCQDNDHLMRILGKLQKLKGVTRTETFISLEQSINRQLKV